LRPGYSKSELGTDSACSGQNSLPDTAENAYQIGGDIQTGSSELPKPDRRNPPIINKYTEITSESAAEINYKNLSKSEQEEEKGGERREIRAGERWGIVGASEIDNASGRAIDGASEKEKESRLLHLIQDCLRILPEEDPAGTTTLITEPVEIFTAEWVREALKESIFRDKRSLLGIHEILDSWMKNGRVIKYSGRK
jgi:hypothetical protein